MGDNNEIAKTDKLLLQNHWANFKQTWLKASLDKGDPVSINKEHSFQNKEVNKVGFVLSTL